ncbi:hypothetical protein F9K91_18880 [Brucella tritici]|uniref:Uncharacterized protein n=1 Tax=Brucella tritici TaxID=94626 RepID=A0A7X6FT39_9HYPH|nr:hypothetical protein [Brucella tritici]KAB2663294.1 hypothetical protein F9K91_18880 [Brucella tritici]NKW11434.1 hypothetical protein [Brucella tritici]
MTDSQTRLFRVELERPNGALDCYPCVSLDTLPELIVPLISSADEPAGTIVRVYDYQRWTPDSENGLIRALSLLE